MSALQKIKLKKNSNPMLETLSNTSAVEVSFKKSLDEERKIETSCRTVQLTNKLKLL